MSERRRPGEAIVLREFHGGRLWEVRPAIVVRDAGEDLSFYVPEGTRPMRAVDGDGGELRVPDRDWRLECADRPGRRAIRSFASTVRPHAALAIWDAGWRPRCWYLNLQLPLRRSPVGFDTTDLVLDLVGTPDAATWSWKDEDDFAAAVAAGRIDAGTAERIREEARALADAVRAGTPPFDGDPWSWRPDPSWAVPDLPEDWDRR